jgi:DNA-binding LacI/PurR family transcriptional regulator
VPRRGDYGRATLEAVAKEAGVSRATVSRVVNGSPSVDPAMAKRVRAAVEKLHYVPNQAARSLMTMRTNTVALVAAESDDRVFGDPFFSSIIRGVSQGLSGSGWQLTLVMAKGDAEVEDATRYLLGGHVDGALLISEHGGHQLAATLADAGIPVVIGGRPMDPSVRAPYVDHNNLGGAQIAARHLQGLGRRRIATITGPLDMSAGVDRLVGFERGLGEAFDPALVENGRFTSASGAEAMTRLLERAPDLDAVFAASDLMALGALQALSRAGRRVPEDVAVVGYDDIALASESSPPLTTVRQGTQEQGRRMARLILQEIRRRADPDAADAGAATPEGIILPVELVVRESA